LSSTQHEVLQQMLGAKNGEIVWAMIRAALASKANTPSFLLKTFWSWGQKRE